MRAVVHSDLSVIELREVESMMFASAGWAFAAGLAVIGQIPMSQQAETVAFALLLSLASAFLLTVRKLSRYVLAIVELYLKRRLRVAARDLGLSKDEIDEIERGLDR